MAHGGYVGKPAKSPADDKVAKIIGHKTPKVSIPKILPNATILQKQPGFSQNVSVKNNRQSNEGIASNVDNSAMHQVLRNITEAAAAQSKRVPQQNSLVKPAAGLKLFFIHVAMFIKTKCILRLWTIIPHCYTQFQQWCLYSM